MGMPDSCINIDPNGQRTMWAVLEVEIISSCRDDLWLGPPHYSRPNLGHGFMVVLSEVERKFLTTV